MSDKPFKMKGHTLPGPSQNSALKARGITDVTGTPNTPGRIPGEGDVFSHFRDLAEASSTAGFMRRKRASRQTKVGEGYEGGEDYSAIQEAQNTQSYVDSGTNTLDTMGDDTTKKKKVDVEVTVNGEPV